ncbi:MAG: flagellar hook-associated protein FlgL, partial [Helicobacter sp.]|nr:flagellar hook-associated protein FlgL [Helicobacter sp.]
MKIGTSSNYTLYQYNQSKAKELLDESLQQVSSGLKIQYGYQDSSIFNKTLSLDYNILTLTQSKDIANNALSYSNNTDNAIKQLVSSMTNFKTKLIQGGNDIHSETSRQAIAKDLRAIRDHFLSIANTSIGGKFIFAGTADDSVPFNPDGTYNGNNASLNALLSANNSISYNITGYELFFGSDNNTHRIISTNIPKFNQRELHPEIMDPNNPSGQGKEVYITAKDSIRDLVGDDDSNPNNDAQEVFYITGRKSNGIAFKAKFSMDTTSKVEDLLQRIGREFGNTEISKVVDVSLNQWGQIEIKDLTNGRSNIEFYMVSSKYKDPTNTAPNGDGVGVADIDKLIQSGAKVNTYVQSPFLGSFSNPSITSTQDYNDHRIQTLPTTFRTQDNELAKTTTLLKDLFPSNVSKIQLSGTAANTAVDTAGNTINPTTLTINDTTTVQDLMDSIKNTYGGDNVEVQLSNGKIIIVDKNVSKRTPPDRDSNSLPYTGSSSLKIQLTAQDANNASVGGFRNDYSVEYDRSNFSKDGAKLTSNVSQVIRNTNEYATMDTKLSEVAGGNLDGHTYNFEVKDVNGIPVRGKIELKEAGSVMTITSPAQMNGVAIQNIEIPILNPNGNPPQVNSTKTPANEVTYQQLADTLGIVMNLSNSNQQDLNNIFNTQADFNDPDVKKSYETLIANSKSSVAITLNADGKLQIKDLNYSATRMEFMLHDSQSTNFTLNASGRVSSTNHPSLTFQANNALVVDDPHVNFFGQIDSIIESLEKGIYRPGGNSAYGDSMRNIGIQNGITNFDHLASHVDKVHTKNGSQGSAFKYSIERTEILIVQTKTLRSETIDTDLA